MLTHVAVVGRNALLIFVLDPILLLLWHDYWIPVHANFALELRHLCSHVFICCEWILWRADHCWVLGCSIVSGGCCLFVLGLVGLVELLGVEVTPEDVLLCFCADLLGWFAQIMPLEIGCGCSIILCVEFAFHNVRIDCLGHPILLRRFVLPILWSTCPPWLLLLHLLVPLLS